jgi:hypothetical protein
MTDIIKAARADEDSVISLISLLRRLLLVHT